MYATYGSVIVGQYKCRYKVTAKSEPIAPLDENVKIFMQNAIERDMHLHKHFNHSYWMLTPLCPTSLVTICFIECIWLKSIDQ